jgi:hypothetical protein
MLEFFCCDPASQFYCSTPYKQPPDSTVLSSLINIFSNVLKLAGLVLYLVQSGLMILIMRL